MFSTARVPRYIADVNREAGAIKAHRRCKGAALCCEFGVSIGGDRIATLVIQGWMNRCGRESWIWGLWSSAAA